MVHNVYLNGNKPARVTCGKWSTGGISLNIWEGGCSTIDDRMALRIRSNTQGDWCFYSTGYMGLGGTTSGDIYNVAYIQSYHDGHGWVMYYNPPFTGGTGIKLGYASNQGIGYPPFNGNQKITQVQVDSVNCTWPC